jgi:hypothetical protein
MIQELKSRTNFNSPKLTRCYRKFGSLLDELRNRELSQNVINQINQELNLINQQHDEKTLKKLISKKQYKIIKLIEKEHKIVPKGYYRNMWLALGMSVFGIPFGVAFGAALSNMAFLGIGIPIGMSIGIAIGAQKDNEAAKKGLQLDFQWG